MDFSLFKDFAELKPFQIILFCVLLAIVALCVVLLVRSHKKAVAEPKSFDIRALVTGALCISLGFVLSYIRLFHMPQGGSITIASMLPVMVYAYWYGPRNGILAGLAYGLLQYIQDPFFVNGMQWLLDYAFAFMSFGLAGFFKKNLLPGVAAAGLARIAFHIVSGAVYFAKDYAPAGQNYWVYSILYNGSVIGPDLLICLVVAALPIVRSIVERLRPASKPARQAAQ